MVNNQQHANGGWYKWSCNCNDEEVIIETLPQREDML